MADDVAGGRGGTLAVRRDAGGPLVLLVRALKDPSARLFPKGHIESGETPEATALRDLYEESAFAGRLLAYIGYSEFPSGNELARVEYFLVNVAGGPEPKGLGEGRE